jgi:hypothetical protein
MSAQAVKNPSEIITATAEEVECLKKHYRMHYRVFQELLASGRARVVDTLSEAT